VISSVFVRFSATCLAVAAIVGVLIPFPQNTPDVKNCLNKANFLLEAGGYFGNIACCYKVGRFLSACNAWEG
jgi:hypothetical protein